MFSAAPSLPSVVAHLLVLSFVLGAALALAASLFRARGRVVRAALLLAALLGIALLLVPDDRREIAASSALPLGVATLFFAFSAAGFRRGGGAGRKAAALVLGATGGAVVVVTSSMAFLTDSYSRWNGETLAALVDVEPARFEAPFTHRTNEAEVSYRAGTEAVDVAVATIEDGRGVFRGRHLLPGDSFGIGGRILEIERFWFVLGKRTYFRVTDVAARFRGRPEVPHYGARLYAPGDDSEGKRLDAKLPLLERRLGEIFGAATRPVDEYDAVVYPARDGRHFTVWARSSGGLVPRAVDRDEFRSLVARYFSGDPFERPEP